MKNFLKCLLLYIRNGQQNVHVLKAKVWLVVTNLGSDFILLKMNYWMTKATLSYSNVSLPLDFTPQNKCPCLSILSNHWFLMKIATLYNFCVLHFVTIKTFSKVKRRKYVLLSHLKLHPTRKEGWGAQRPVIYLEQSMKNESNRPLLFPRHTMAPEELRDHILAPPIHTVTYWQMRLPLGQNGQKSINRNQWFIFDTLNEWWETQTEKLEKTKLSLMFTIQQKDFKFVSHQHTVR